MTAVVQLVCPGIVFTFQHVSATYFKGFLNIVN